MDRPYSLLPTIYVLARGLFNIIKLEYYDYLDEGRSVRTSDLIATYIMIGFMLMLIFLEYQNCFDLVYNLSAPYVSREVAGLFGLIIIPVGCELSRKYLKDKPKSSESKQLQKVSEALDSLIIYPAISFIALGFSLFVYIWLLKGVLGLSV
jgi:hypothetical protein